MIYFEFFNTCNLVSWFKDFISTDKEEDSNNINYKSYASSFRVFEF